MSRWKRRDFTILERIGKSVQAIRTSDPLLGYELNSLRRSMHNENLPWMRDVEGILFRFLVRFLCKEEESVCYSYHLCVAYLFIFPSNNQTTLQILAKFCTLLTTDIIRVYVYYVLFIPSTWLSCEILRWKRKRLK